MIKNYFKIALRTVKRNSIYSIISVLGLAIGITGASLLYLYIDNELSYDAFHEESDRIYRIVEISESAERGTRYFGQTAPILGSTLEEQYPEIDEMVRVYKPRGHIDMLWKGERIHERNYLITDSDFFAVFDFEFLSGNSVDPLSRPNTAVITERKARELFGEENPIGKVLPVNGMEPVEITGVIENIPDNSHLQFDILLSRRNSVFNWEDYLNNWEAYGAFTYVMLTESADLNTFKDKIDSYINEQQANNDNARNFYLQPITDIYLNSGDIEFGIAEEHGNIFYIYIFSAIGIFLLLIAGIN
ncbi:MAG: ABC transporter permease, partial [Balneolaceae bacterium]|nr:ABC transporter permease [Balneolaceae bacterium]